MPSTGREQETVFLSTPLEATLQDRPSHLRTISSNLLPDTPPRDKLVPRRENQEQTELFNHGGGFQVF